mgnify:CR=1 FL=1
MRGKLKDILLMTAFWRITPAHAGKTNVPAALFLRGSDHPRACGENPMRRQSRFATSGSPPRMRGKPISQIFACLKFRITPAHAGKTTCAWTVPISIADHPRACGENSLPKHDIINGSGSPPRMRGKRIAFYTHFILNRITPAHAGKTRYTLPAALPGADHPRACGENHILPPVSVS